jgi:hypothetical protein
MADMNNVAKRNAFSSAGNRLRVDQHMSSHFTDCTIITSFAPVWEGKRPLGRPRHSWDDNIKTDLREKGIGGANWIRLAQDRVEWWAFVNTVMNLRVP